MEKYLFPASWADLTKELFGPHGGWFSPYGPLILHSWAVFAVICGILYVWLYKISIDSESPRAKYIGVFVLGYAVHLIMDGAGLI
jgi:hypothetical protein